MALLTSMEGRPTLAALPQAMDDGAMAVPPSSMASVMF
jgi:hypothetical protein